MHRFVARLFSLAAPIAVAGMLGGCVWQSDYDKLKAENDQLKQQMTTQQQQMQAEIDAAKARAGRLGEAIAYTVNSDLAFKSGSWEMSERGKQLISQYAEKLAPGHTAHLLVKGYTDNRPIGSALKAQGVDTNEALSQKRADAVRDYLIAQGFKAELIEAKGYGEADPVDSNDTAAGRKKNRRVVIQVEGQS